jgi:hypothetical protein
MSFARTWTPPMRLRDREPPAVVRRVERPCTYQGGTSGPAPKTVPYRDRALLDMARGRPCLLMVPGCCSHRLDTVVAAHSNWPDHGKAGARKADDCYSVAACHACHSWLDQGPAPAAQKRAQFMAAHKLQMWAWQNIAAASDEPQRFRRAARRALEHLKGKP